MLFLFIEDVMCINLYKQNEAQQGEEKKRTGNLTNVWLSSGDHLWDRSISLENGLGKKKLVSHWAGKIKLLRMDDQKQYSITSWKASLSTLTFFFFFFKGLCTDILDWQRHPFPRSTCEVPTQEVSLGDSSNIIHIFWYVTTCRSSKNLIKLLLY